jgi:hypothetical protein
VVATGIEIIEGGPEGRAWAEAALVAAQACLADPDLRRANLRHAETWFVGVDVLPNAPDGSIEGVLLPPAYRAAAGWRGDWHRAQLSVVYPGYPRRDPEETEAAHRFRVTRSAAHVDGLLPEGSARRRFLREPHAFILGLPLTDTRAAPLVVWPGSHVAIGQALRAAVGDADPGDVDLTEAYHAARRAVFDSITPRRIEAAPGQGILLHRHLLHGVAPWEVGSEGPPDGRAIAYFRPQFAACDWLKEDI